MNQWRKQFQNHQLHKELAEMNKLIHTATLKTTAANLGRFPNQRGSIHDCNE